MKMVPTYVLTPEEYFTVRRIRHLLGYSLDEPERKQEQDAAGCLFRKNDPFRTEHYEVAYEALSALRKRLRAEADPTRWEDAAKFMADERRVQADMVDEAIEALPHPRTLLPTPADHG